MTDNDALNQTRDALHIAFTLIANARNSLDNNVSNRDPVLADQWHEAAARFMQDYNTNLDAYTGYRVSGRNECPTCSGPVRETVGMVCQTCGTDYGKEPCGEECGNSVHMHRCQITDGVPHDHICYDCGYTWTDPTESTLWKCDDCGGMFFDRESHACPNAIERLTAERNEFKKDRDALRQDWKRVMEATMAAKRGITPAEMEQRLVNAAQSWERDNDERMRLHRGLLIWVPVALAFWALIAVMWMELT